MDADLPVKGGMSEVNDKIVADKAREIVIEKLISNGIDYKEISEEEFNDLVENRKQVLLRDMKQSLIVGGIGAGLTIFGGI